MMPEKYRQIARVTEPREFVNHPTAKAGGFQGQDYAG